MADIAVFPPEQLERLARDPRNAHLRAALQRELARRPGLGLGLGDGAAHGPERQKPSNGAGSPLVLESPAGEALRTAEPPRIALPAGGYRLMIMGAPRTKKNHGTRLKIGGQVKTVPSAAWRAWRDEALKQIPAGMLPDAPYNCAALFYRDRAAGDAVGYFQGLADVLQEAGVVSDDKWLLAWDGSRLMKDATNPRVELMISALTPTEGT